MHRKAIWIGIGVLVIGYVVWAATRNVGRDSTDLATLPMAAPTVQGVQPSNTPGSGSASAGSSRPKPTGNATLLLNAGRVTRTSTVSASGFGMDPHEKLRLEWVNPYGKPATLTTGSADEHGNFGGLNFKIPITWADGNQTIEITGLASGRTSRAQITIVPAAPGAVASTYFGKPMSKVDFTGGGFKPNETVEIYFDSLASSPAGQVQADANGQIKAKGVLVPPASTGDHAFLLVGQTSGSPVRVPFSVLAFAPWLSLTNYTPQPENSIGVIGHDFAPGEKIAVFLTAPTGPPIAEGVANSKGVAQINSAFSVPYGDRGKLLVVAVGTVSQTPATATMTVRPYTPLFALSTYAGPPGTAVAANGSGFGHNERLTLRFGATATDATSTVPTLIIQSDATGAFKLTTPFHIPDRAKAGKMTISIVGDHSQEPATTTFAVLPITPWIAPIPAAGQTGRTVAIDGGGFEPNETIVLTLGGTKSGPTSSVVADAKGNVHDAGSLPIPRGATGRVAIQADGSRSGGQANAVYTVTGAQH